MPLSPSSHRRHRVFNRSFDTASQNTDDSYETGHNLRGRRTVPYVNERREFDPRYDPRKEETILLQHQPRRMLFDDEDRVSPDADHLTNVYAAQARYGVQYSQSAFPNSQHQQFFGAGTNSGYMHSRSRDIGTTHGVGYFEQSRQNPTPSIYNSGPRVKTRGSFFHADDARLDRPFDESSNGRRGSTSEIDSLDEVLQQDSFTTATETTGEDRVANVLSAIEEHPSLEAGSTSFSYAQGNGSVFPVTESSSHPAHMQNLGSRSRSPFGGIQQSETADQVFRNHELGSARSPNLSHAVSEQHVPRHHPIPITSNEAERAAQSVRPPRANTWDLSNHSGKTEHLAQSVRPLRVNTWDTSNHSSEHHGIFSRCSAATTPETPSAASNGLTSIVVAQRETEKWLQSRRRKDPEYQSTNEKSSHQIAANTSASTTEETDTLKSEDQDLTLHDLCGESSSTDDVAWRNALHVLSIQPHLASVVDGTGWTPLHVACLGSTPPPLFMIRSLLYVSREAARKVDGGGRLPLHVVAASSGDAETMQLLIQEYPQGVYQIDCQGWTPLHLILKNFSVDISLSHCRILLGLTTLEKTESKSARVLQRRGEHLSLPLDELDRLVHKATPVTRLTQENMHETAFRDFPLDIQTSLRRLCQWKRKQRRLSNQTDPDDPVELDLDAALSSDAETNPAAHFTPVKRQLPIHIIVRRGLSENGSQYNHDYEDDGRDDREESTPTGLSPRFLELVRLFIAFYPEGLIARDFNGHTPLLTALTMTHAQPSLELVELLLGKRTSGYNTLPSWAQDMPLYTLNADRYLNPAMIPCKKSHQLPLHLVAEEMARHFTILSSVHGCYPGAIQCQDARGRTPLHIILRNYRRSQVDPRTVALLVSDNVAQTLDDEGKLPFDLLAETAGNILPKQPHSIGTQGAAADDILAFKKFFQGTIIASSGPSVRNRLESDKFLLRLRSLPPWLRRQACAAPFVQELLIEELASPLKCALILLYATLLCALIAAFRIQVQSFIREPEAALPTWTLLVVHTAAAGLFVFQLVFWSLCKSMSEVLHLCVFSIWRWTDLLALVFSLVATSMLDNSSASTEAILGTATAATGLLWFSAVGFVSSWWYGASLFTTSVQQIAKLLFWPLTIAAILTVGFSQMFYTVRHITCAEDPGDSNLCSVRDSYMLVYFLMIGEPIVNMDNNTRTQSSVIILALLFATALLLLALSIMAMIVLGGSNCDYEELSLAYWEPKLTFVIFACGKESAFFQSKLSASLEVAWIVATDILSGRDGAKGTYWYACFSRKSAFVKAGYWMVTVIIVPIWILAGLITFGLLWPPQVRRFLFRPQAGAPFRQDRGNKSPPEVYASHLSSLRNELTQIRDMSYERSNDVQRDLRHLKEILHLATAD